MPKQLRNDLSNGEGPSDGEKPLKKARFVWELKGKHHLKETENNNNLNEEALLENTNINYFSTIEQIDNLSAEENSEKSISLESHASSSQAKSDKRCNSGCLQTLLERTSNNFNDELDELSNEIDFTMGSPNSKNQEYYLHKWQTKQIARGFVENAINSVLETWSHRPLQAADFLDNYASDGQVEDNAILMAIQSHGLQSAGSGLISTSTHQEELLERNPDILEFTHDNLENIENERVKKQNPETDSGSSCEINPVNQENLCMEETTDFLNAAVSVAIQKKGLSYGY